MMQKGTAPSRRWCKGGEKGKGEAKNTHPGKKPEKGEDVLGSQKRGSPSFGKTTPRSRRRRCHKKTPHCLGAQINGRAPEKKKGFAGEIAEGKWAQFGRKGRDNGKKKGGFKNARPRRGASTKEAGRSGGPENRGKN